MSEFDAAAAAARATGDDPPTSTTADEGENVVAPDHQDAEGTSTDDGIGSVSRWREMLMSNDPDPPLENVDSPWDPDLGGLTRVYRGILKMGGFDGTPAVVDLGIGAIEALQNVEAEDVDADQEDGDQEAESQGADVL